MSAKSALPPALPTDLVQQVQRLAAHFEAGWQAGSPPPLEDQLDQVAPEGRPELFRQLVRLEADFRQQQGNPLTAAEARQRFSRLGPWVAGLLPELDDSPALTLEVVAGPQAGRRFQMAGHTTFYVGRGPSGVHLALEGDPGMSRVHFLVEFNPPRARLEDLRSKNGTFVNGKKVQHADLRDGDEVLAGNTRFRVELPQGERTVTVEAPGQSIPPTDLPPPPAPRLLAFAGYTLEGELGTGGMGVVYRARRHGDGQLVAIKTVLPAVAPRPETLARFQREVAILRRLEHPHIVRFLDSGEAGGLLYFVMEYVEGPSAARLVKLDGPMAPGRVVALGCQLLEALAHAHLQGIVHRDVKPGNVLLAQHEGREVLKLADFGLGRAYQESAMSGLTIAGTPGGTPGYMPPEQVLDFRAARPAADQYATAATLYYLLTGQPVYEPAASPTDLLVRILQHEPIPLRPASPGPALPPKLHAVLCRALAREPRQRFPDVLGMREALARAV
jgi:serine/threonine-protein kinase